MRSFIFYVVGLLGSVIIAPTLCPAEDSDRFSFPLPLSLEVGDHWTYSIVTTHWKDEDRSLDTLAIETLTIRVVERLQIEGQPYFALSDGGIYRVDEASRTWRYDTEAKSEKIVWDIWGPQSVVDRKLVIEKAVVDSYPRYGSILRRGPFVLRPIPEPGYEGVYTWIQTIEADTVRYDLYLGNFIYFPFTLTYADILKYPDWGITELYVFGDKPFFNLVVAPKVGVVYYGLSFYSYSPSAGKVGFMNSQPPYPLDYIEKTEWILQDVQKGDPESTVVEDISFGELKQRMTHPASDDP